LKKKGGGSLEIKFLREKAKTTQRGMWGEGGGGQKNVLQGKG